MLQSDLCDYSDAYIFVERDITFDGDNIRDRKNKSLAFKSNASLISCISKINSVLIENAEDLDVVMPMYNLLKYLEKQQEAYRIITEMSQILFLLLILLLILLL